MVESAPVRSVSALPKWSIILGTFLVLTSLSITLISWNLLSTHFQQKSQREFEQRSQATAQYISHYFEDYLQDLIAVEQAIKLKPDLTATEFKAHAENLKLAEVTPGFASVAFLQKVTFEDKAAFVKAIREKEGPQLEPYISYDIHPVATKSEYIVSKFIYPLKGREKGLGFDYSSEAFRASIVEKAKNSKEVVLTPPIISLITKQKVFTFILPTFRTEPNQATVDTFEGIITASFDVNSFFTELFAKNKPFTDMSIRIRDVEASPEHSTLFEEFVTQPNYKDLKTTIPITIADKVWLIDFSASPDFSLTPLERRLPQFILFIGLLFTLCLMGLMYLLFSSRIKIAHMNKSLRDSLSQSELKYQQIFENLQDVYYQTDLEGKVITISPSITKFTGKKVEDILGQSAESFYINPEERQHLVNKLMTEGSINDYFVTLKGRNNQPIAVSVTAQVLKNEKGQPTGIEGLLRDITDSRKAQHDLQQRTQELERLNQIMVNRELKMLDLKKELEQLKAVNTS